MFLSAGTIGFLVALSILTFVGWYYYKTEIARNKYLKSRISSVDEADTSKSKRKAKISEELENMNDKMSYEKLVLIGVFGACISFIVLFMVNAVFFGILFAGAFLFTPEIYVELLKMKRKRNFKEQFPDALRELLSVMRSGQTPLQGFQLLSETAEYPMRKEFQRIYNDINTGGSMESALRGFYKRNPSSDTELFVTGLIIARHSSPKVAISTIDTIITIIRVREGQKKSTASMVASGKLTAIILAALPLFIFAGLETFMPTYINDFLDLTIGKIAVGFAFVLDMIGFFVARKITDSSDIVGQ